MAEPDLKFVVQVMRALLQSAPSDGLLTRQLLNDYKSYEGSPLPFRQLGFDSVDDLIQKSGEFVQRRTHEGVKIIPKEKSDSAHINRMVQQQRPTKKKKRPTMPQRPIRSPTANNQQPRWSGSAYSSMYSGMPNRSVKKTMAAPAKIPSLLSLKIDPPMRSNRQYEPTQSTQNFIGRNQSMATPSATSTPFAQKNVNQDMRPITKQSNINENSKFNYNSNKIDPPAPPSTNPTTQSNSQAGNRILNRISANQNQNNNQITSNYSVASQVTASRPMPIGPISPNGCTINTGNNITKMKVNLSDRLASKKPLAEQIATINLDSDVVDFVTATATNDSNEVNNEVNKEFTNDQTKIVQFDELDLLIPTEALAKFCECKRYASPTYKCFRTPKTHKFQCRVTVNNVIYSTYPSEFETELDARVDAARSAFQQMKEAEMAVKYEVCTDNFMELAFKIRDCIPSSNGVFQKKIPEMFQEMHKLMLPENWCEVIIDYPQLFSSDDGIGDKIIYKIMDSEPETVAASDISSATSITRTIKLCDEPEELTLPWNEKHWNVFITNPVSTVEVWARIIGPEYSGKMDSLLTDIELALFSNKKAAETIHIGKIYLVMISECWYRVRIERKNMEQKRVCCFFIDVGDEDWYSVDEIYECHSDFVRFPAQAICFTLLGLEDFAENPNARQQVDDHLAGKSLIAEILTKQDDYVAKVKSNDLEAKIQTILYDTSSDEDVQLNPLISEKICQTTEAPQLQRLKINHVNISHITDTGDIYCQLANSKSSLQYINKLIHQLTDGSFDFTKYRYVASDVEGNVMARLYLIYDKGEDKWYRAAILPMNMPTTERCICIDYGMAKTIDREHIFRLDLLSAALSLYPKQAILVRLNEISSYNENVIARLRGLLNPTSTVMAQVVSGNSIPLVNIYKRLETTKVLCKINDTIRMEQELENSSDLMFDENDSFNSSNEYASSIKSMKISKRNHSFELPQYDVPSQDDYFNCVVTMASNPSNFTVQPFKPELEFQTMMENLQKYCNANNKTRLAESEIREGECFAGRSKDSIWYRVIIQRVMSTDMILAYNCDYGDIAMLTTNELISLPEQFLKLPQLAIKAKLYGVRPKNKDWSTDDCTRFQKLTVGKRFASEIKAINRDQKTYELEMILIDVSTERDIVINNVLVDEGRAN